MNRAWKTELFAVLALFGTALLCGYWLGNPVELLSAAVLVYLLWLLANLWRLQRWLAQDANETPDFAGLSKAIATGVKETLEAGTKRKRKRAGSQKRLREAISALPDAAVIIDRRDQIQWSNPAARPLLGLEWPKGRGQAITQLIPQPSFRKYMEGARFDKPLETISPTGGARYLSIKVTRFGNKRQRLLVASDVTTLHNLDRVRRDFVANVSHELRTPLTVITGFLETMGEEAGTCPEWSRSVDLMEQQARRMQTLINDLLVLSKLEMDTSGDRDPIAVPILLQAIVEEARTVSGPNQHRIGLEADPELWLLGNPEQLHSVFSNLVVNAVQHTPPGSEVRVSWNRKGNEAYFGVHDNGEGIPDKHLPRLTERFYRVDKARSRRKGGTGLGLAIVKHALARHDSRLEVTSEEGQGASFECRFPGARIIPPR